MSANWVVEEKARFNGLSMLGGAVLICTIVHIQSMLCRELQQQCWRVLGVGVCGLEMKTRNDLDPTS